MYISYQNGPNPNGRPSALPQGAKEFIIEVVRTQFEQKTPVTYDFLYEALQKKFNVRVKSDTLRHFCRSIKEIKAIDGFPMEKERVQVRREDIEQYYRELAEYLANIPGEFIFNVDEAGCSEWTDTHVMRVLVPSGYDQKNIKIPRDRMAKRASLVGCICADGSVLKPMVILPRKTIEAEMQLYGYNKRNAAFAYQENSFMTMKIFEQWGEKIFFPHVDAKRKEMNYGGQALLIMDGLAAHHSPSFCEECAKHGVKILYMVPHSSDQTQPLDLVVFGRFKNFYSRCTNENMISNQSNQIIKMLCAWRQATAPNMIISSFMAAGMKPSIEGDWMRYSIDLELASKLRNWETINQPYINEPEMRRRTRITN